MFNINNKGFYTSTPRFGDSSTPNFFNRTTTNPFSCTRNPFDSFDNSTSSFTPKFSFQKQLNFGAQCPQGTVIKFVPVKLTDTAIIKGINHTINGTNQCITCMKEYEDKSLEELRWEDYQANRKGPQDTPDLFLNEPMAMELPPEENLNKNFGYKFSNAPTGLFGKPVFEFGTQNTTQQSTTTNIFHKNTPTSTYQQSPSQRCPAPALNTTPTPITITQNPIVKPLVNTQNYLKPTFKYNPTPPQMQIINQPQQQQPNQSNHDRILSMSSNPYGISDLLNNIKEIDNIIKESARATNPQQLNILLKSEPKHEKPIQVRKVDQFMFDGLTNESHRNPKKLTLKKTEASKMVAVGIILKRPEYYTIPPINQLTLNNGSCIVQGFTVGRHGYGNVYFPDTFDVANLNIDELIVFCHKEITIYPDETKKPPPGQGLNRSAQITLDNVWPLDKKTNQHIKDVAILAEMNYSERLRRLCERQQTIFVDYQPQTGSWIFKVEHFSKYGDDTSDEDLPYMVPLEKSYFNYYKIIHDLAGYKGRSYKIGWTVKMQFVTLKQANNTRENSIQINQIQFTWDQCLEKHLNIQINNSHVTENNLASNIGFHLLQEQKKCCDCDVWELCSALWGGNNLTTWLQNAIKKTITFNKEDGLYQTIIKHLSLYQIECAAQLAFQYNHIFLSMLISQLPSNNITKNLVIKQLHLWENMSDLIDDDLIKIYLIIAGLPEYEYGNKTIRIFDEMNWLQIFAIHLWYIGANYDKTENSDIRYQLLKYFNDSKYPISHVLNSASTDMSWFLLQILESLGVADNNEKLKTYIHLNFAAQLEILNWEWAVFIILFLQDTELKTRIIKDIIGRNICTSEILEKELFLLNLKIPSKWIENAKAIYALNEGKTGEAICYFSYAEKYHEAYNLLMSQLLPYNFFAYDYELLHKLLTPFSRQNIPNWNQHGGLIIDFAKLGLEPQNINESMRFRSSVVNIYTRFADLSDLSFIRCRNWNVLDHLLN